MKEYNVAVFEDDYNAQEVFKYAREAQLVTGAVHPKAEAKYGFTQANVTEVLYRVEGEREMASWIAVVRLDDGSFGAVRAGCDYTGWGCQEWGDAARSEELDLIVRWWLEEDERRRLGLPLDPA